MKKTLLSFILILSFVQTHAALKELTYYFDSNTLLWENRSGYIPCREIFNFKIVNYPANTVSITVNIYNSTGKYATGRKTPQVTRTGLISTYTALPNDKKEFYALISNPLDFRRYYYIEVIANTSITDKVSVASNVNVAVNGPVVNGGLPGTTVSTTTTVTTTTPAGAVPVTNTVTETQTRSVVTNTFIRVFSIPPKNEISSIQFLGSAGDAMFFQKNWSRTDDNFGFVTGVKIKIKPVSLNPDIGRFGLYWRSHLSIVLGTEINDLKYKSTTITAVGIGLKPVVGIDYELNETFGLTIGTIIGRQEKLPALDDSKELVFGLFLGCSFSVDFFKAFKGNTPANGAFPNTQ